MTTIKETPSTEFENSERDRYLKRLQNDGKVKKMKLANQLDLDNQRFLNNLLKIRMSDQYASVNKSTDWKIARERKSPLVYED